MKRVWKCDFCCHTEVSKEKMIEHENKCYSNPTFKKCWSCKFHDTYCDSYICNAGIELYYEYEDDGNCPKWQTDDEKLLRKLKLKKLEENVL